MLQVIKFIEQAKQYWMIEAFFEMGVSEDTSQKKHNAKIIEYHSTTENSKSDETPWCSSFVNWVMKNSGIEGTNSSWALTWLKWQNGERVKEPLFGSIAVFKRYNADGKFKGGHVGFVVGINSKRTHVAVLGGNQNNKVQIKYYPIKSSRYRLVGYMFPIGDRIKMSAPVLNLSTIQNAGSSQ
jgi:uncharacterized protein (TIGR02594 family)